VATSRVADRGAFRRDADRAAFRRDADRAAFRRDATVLIAIALALRLMWLLVAAREPRGMHDPVIYLVYGRGLVDTGQYLAIMRTAKTAYFPVGYPFFVSLVMRAGDLTGLWSYGFLPQQVANVVVGAAAAPLTYWVATWVVPRKVAKGAALVVAVMPSQILYSSTILSEVLFQALLLGCVGCLFAARRMGGQSGAPAGLALFAGGVLLGAATMVRGVAAIVPIVVLAVLARTVGWRAAVRATAIVCVGAAVLTVPWALRNVAVFDRWVGLSTNVGDDFCIGNAPGASGAFELQPACFTDANADMFTPAAEAGRSDEAMDVGLTAIRDDPGRMPGLTVRKARALMSRDWDGLWVAESYGEDRFLPAWARTAIVWGANGSWFTLLAFSAWGLFALGRQRSWPPRLLVAMPLALLVLPLAFFGEPRFHFPAVPFLAIAASVALSDITNRSRSRRS
jgi:4-amino-4-deoxy-L-arabinose transferase-like glycosyltransferase